MIFLQGFSKRSSNSLVRELSVLSACWGNQAELLLHHLCKDIWDVDAGIFVRNPPPELVGRESLAMPVKRFRTWVKYNGCDQALETNSVVKTEETIRTILEMTNGKQLVTQSFIAWGALNKAFEKDNV